MCYPVLGGSTPQEKNQNKMNRKLVVNLFLAFVSVLALALPGMALAQGGGTIAYGQVVTGEITQDAPEVRYTFTGAAGDVVVIRMNATQPGLDSYLELLGPDGQSLQTNDDSGGSLNSLLGPFRLPASGTYTVIATRFMRDQGSSSGPFELSLNTSTLNPLSLNETITVTLDEAQPAVYFSYTGAAGEMLAVSGQAVGGDASSGQGTFILEVRDPAGLVMRNMGDMPGIGALIDPLVLTQTGEHLFTVARQTSGMGGPTQPTGAVTVQFTVRPIQTQPIERGQTVQGTLDDNNPSDHYIFSGAAGDLLRVEVTQGANGQPVDVQVISTADGSYAGGNNTSNSTNGVVFIDPIQVNNAGAYLIIVSRYSMGVPSVGGLSPSYTLTFGATETPALQPGVAIEGAFTDPNVYEQVYSFAGTAGQTIRITLRGLSANYGTSIDVQGPDGSSDYQPFYLSFSSSTSGAFSYEVQLPMDGTYLFRVHNSMSYGPMPATSPASGGQYRLMVEVVG